MRTPLVAQSLVVKQEYDEEYEDVQQDKA